MSKQDSHITPGKTGNKVSNSFKEKISGPVTQKHRNRLGEADGVHNPNGVGEVSKKSTVRNDGGRNY